LTRREQEQDIAPTLGLKPRMEAICVV